MHRIRPPVGKDVTAFWQAGGRVRDWVRFELACSSSPVSRDRGERRNFLGHRRVRPI